MKVKDLPWSSTKPTLIAIWLVLAYSLAVPAFGSGFQLSEQSVTGLGQAYAGSGVSLNDASVVFYNPAAMSLLRGQHFQAGVNGVFIDTKFNNDGNSTSNGLDSDGDSAKAIPNLYYVAATDNKVKWGVGITAPFGLKTEYDRNWVGRYQAIESEFQSINLGPSLSFKLNENFSIGAGVDIQYAEATLSRASPPILPPLAADSFIEVEGDSWAYGYNAGILYQPSSTTRFGISYRSKMEHELKGKTQIAGSNIGLDGNYNSRAKITLPETAYLSGAFDLNPDWTLFASARWTRWERFDQLQVEIDSLPDEVVPERWKNTWMYSVGANLQLNRDITLRGGIARDTSPVPNDNLRSARIPDSDRDWLTLGITLKGIPNIALDFSAAYLHADKSKIDNTVALNSPIQPLNRLSGNIDSNVVIVGAQLQYFYN